MLAVCWSSLFTKFSEETETESTKHVYSMLAVALKDGHIALWTVSCPAAEARFVCCLMFQIWPPRNLSVYFLSSGLSL